MSTYGCPKCNAGMEEVEFSSGYPAPDGEPGLLCHDCGYKMAGEELKDYLIS